MGLLLLIGKVGGLICRRGGIGREVSRMDDDLNVLYDTESNREWVLSSTCINACMYITQVLNKYQWISMFFLLSSFSSNLINQVKLEYSHIRVSSVLAVFNE